MTWEVTNDAIDRAYVAANPEWKRLVYGVLKALAQKQATVTTDQLWDALDEMGAIPEQREPRALGGVVRCLVRDGVLAPSLEYKLCARPSMHKRPIRVWKSLVFAPGDGGAQ